MTYSIKNTFIDAYKQTKLYRSSSFPSINNNNISYDININFEYNFTTILIKNKPPFYTYNNIKLLLDVNGFKNTYEFINYPLNINNENYIFIKFKKIKFTNDFVKLANELYLSPHAQIEMFRIDFSQLQIVN